jgi:hypothetical protein
MVDFGMNAVGVPAQRLLTLASVGAGPVTVTAFRIDGQDAALFRIEPDAGPAAALAAGTPLVLAPSESAQVAVGFTFQGNHQAVGATLVLQTDGDPAEVAVQLAGLGQVGFDCHPVFVPALVTFGQVLVGTAQDLPLVLRNQGNGACEVFQPRLQACAVSGESGIATCDEPTKGPSSASFELVDAPPSTMVLQGQQSWPMTVRFDPAGAGTVAALVGVMVRDPQTKKTMRLPEPGPDGGWSPNVIGLGVLPNPP